jgi:hypothetical protein
MGTWQEPSWTKTSPAISKSWSSTGSFTATTYLLGVLLLHSCLPARGSKTKCGPISTCGNWLEASWVSLPFPALLSVADSTDSATSHSYIYTLLKKKKHENNVP